MGPLAKLKAWLLSLPPYGDTGRAKERQTRVGLLNDGSLVMVDRRGHLIEITPQTTHLIRDTLVALPPRPD